MASLPPSLLRHPFRAGWHGLEETASAGYSSRLAYLRHALQTSSPLPRSLCRLQYPLRHSQRRFLAATG
eukprot:1947401-Pleurochrysis_carterae.AAC.1